MARNPGFRCGMCLLLLWPFSAQSQDATPSRRIADVAFPAAGFVDPPPSHSPRIAAIVAEIKLPVLIPDSFARYKSFDVISTGPYDYTASIRLDGVKLWINGTRQEVVPPEGAAAMTDHEPEPGAFTEPDPVEPRLNNRRFTRYGAGYVISAECARPADKRCEDAYLATLEQSSKLFGGSK